jgi:hypothetical protein
MIRREIERKMEDSGRIKLRQRSRVQRGTILLHAHFLDSESVIAAVLNKCSSKANKNRILARAKCDAIVRPIVVRLYETINLKGCQRSDSTHHICCENIRHIPGCTQL